MIRHSEETICKMLLENRDNNIFYIKIDHRLSDYWKENKGKIASKVYPHHHDYIKNINNYTIELIYPRSSNVYQDYFEDEDYKPFITEVWKRENNIMKLMYFRSDENSDFIDVEVEKLHSLENELNTPNAFINELYKQLFELQSILIPQSTEECRIHKAKVDLLKQNIGLAEKMLLNKDEEFLTNINQVEIVD